MADSIQEFKAHELALEKMTLPTSAMAAAPADICTIWKQVKPFVEIGIKLLSLLPFDWAKKLAGALELLEKALNTFCP